MRHAQMIINVALQIQNARRIIIDKKYGFAIVEKTDFGMKILAV